MKKRDYSNLIYGIRAVIEAIKSGQDLERIFIQKGLKGDLISELKGQLRNTNAPMSMVPVEKINRLTRKNHQGVAAFISPVKYHTLSQLVLSLFENGENPFLVLLDRITDVRNFGAIARSAEGTGAHGIIIPIQEAAQINADSVKTSAGALNLIPVCREHDLKESIKYLKESGFHVVASTEKAEDPLQSADFQGPVCVILGSEEDGISSEVLRVADQLVRVPMKGKIDSLNVSAAAAMAFYEVVRQRS
ncbi:MAG: 23S rRNA (guanosine(2251)-2'-O)-methyltransferase RlmB [Cyclobacteriaceae bacterium]|nr:23S rRNA (guanosine(2251)-2'-O)-methyltransferase RlmB [Cyclobacteriaceae bacterium HetDA_MAG_MS6]